MTSKRISVAVVGVFCLLFTGAAAFSQDNLPDMPDQFDKGWNMISTPCEVAVGDVKQALGTDGVKLYSWNGSEYVEPETLKPGAGYLMDSPAVLNTSYICNSGKYNTRETVSYTQGWNLVGNPFGKATTFRELFGDRINDIDAIYQLKGNKFDKMTADDNVKPWRGYWIHTTKAFSVDFLTDFELKITAYTDAEKTQAAASPVELASGGKLYLTAAAVFTADGDTAETMDVTDTVTWSVTGGAGAMSGKVFTAISAGESTITATYLGGQTASLSVKVSAGDSECEKIRIAYDGYDNDLYTKYNSEKSDDEQCSYYRQYSSTQKFEVYCWELSSSYSYRFIKDSAITFKVICVNETTPYSGYDYFKNGTDVTASATITSADETIASITDVGILTGNKAGAVTLTATYKGLSHTLKTIVETDGLTAIDICANIGSGDAAYGPKLKCDNYYNYGYYGDSSAGDSDENGTKISIVQSAKTVLRAYGIFKRQSYSYSSQRKDISDSVTWQSSDESIATVDSKGALTAKSPGAVTITATQDGFSDSITVQVVADNTLIELSLEPSYEVKLMTGGSVGLYLGAKYLTLSSNCTDSDGYPTPSIYDYHYYSYGNCYLKKVNVTNEAAWNMSNDSVGAVVDGSFVASETNEGVTTLSGEYGGLTSNSLSIEVKDWPFTISAEVYPGGSNSDYYGYYYQDLSCCVHIKNGEEGSVYVSAYTIGAGIYFDVTSKTTWEISDPSVAEISGDRFIPKKQGLIWVRATVEDARSPKIWVLVTDGKPMDFLFIHSTDSWWSNRNRPVKAGEKMDFTATRYSFKPEGETVRQCYSSYYSYYSDQDNCYDETKYFISTDVSQSAEWKSSAPSVASMNKSALTGVSQGFADVTATHNGIVSNTVTVDVWNESGLSYCDSSNVNSAEWTNTYTTAALETDCQVYSKGEKVNIRYTAEAVSGINQLVDICLDLYVLDEAGNIVKTFREEKCSSESLTKSTARTADPVYQYFSSWDMKDNNGREVATGKYFAVARFYIVWEPVLRVPFVIQK